MTYVSDFKFNELSRIGNDSCCLDQNSIQNTESCNYTLQNYFLKDCEMTNARALATSQPFINYAGAYGMSVGGCNVDSSSQLLIGGVQTHPKSKIDLFSRPFATVPYLGRGAVDPVLESQMQQGEPITNKRSITRLTEKTFLKYHTVPLISEMQQKMQRPELMIESVAAEGWIRGGLPSRELTRDNTQ